MSRREAFLKINLGSRDEAEALCAVLKPEVEDSSPGTSLERNGSTISLKISSSDASAFRAILASYSRFIRIHEDIKKISA